ncbi:MAG: NAD(P)-binding protein [Pseudomonadales bacterium]|nr:NAD(P)-binding protein [Pseudomonadales bacterium]
MAKPKRIAILGGGISSLVTAFELTNRPNWQQEYEITVHQMGWRLGGKGASGRNADIHQRIEEHGLHVFFGFYENTMRIMQQVYKELDRHPDKPLATWEQAFKPHNYVSISDSVGGKPFTWGIDFPERPGFPGDASPPPDVWDLLSLMLEFNLDFFEDWITSRLSSLAPFLPQPVLQSIKKSRKELFKLLDKDHDNRLLDDIFKGSVDALTSIAALLFDPGNYSSNPFARISKKAIDAVSDLSSTGAPVLKIWFALAALKKQIDNLSSDRNISDRQALDRIHIYLNAIRSEALTLLEPQIHKDQLAYQVYVTLDLSISTISGLIHDELIEPPVNWFKIDHTDIRSWFKKHGASQLSVDAGPVQAMLDTAFSSQSGVGAGTYLQSAFQILFGYKGSIMWKLQAGMGDVIFTPLYEVLRKRGVKFEFFHRVDNISLSNPKKDGKRIVSEIHIGRQVSVKKAIGYQPLVEVKGLACWPDRPDYSQLIQGDALKAFSDKTQDQHKTLENWWTAWPDAASPLVLKQGKDFDHVVLGISLGALPYICKEIIADPLNPAFAEMVSKVNTTATQAMQLWFNKPLAALGWKHPSTVLTAFEEPFDTWMDASQAIKREEWNKNQTQCIAYLCSPDSGPHHTELPPRTEHDYPLNSYKDVVSKGQNWLSKYASNLWPKYHEQLLVDGYTSQYWTSVWNPSDRYVLSSKDSVQYRLRAEQSGYANLTLTGDWIKTSLSVGCAEAATMAGMHASRAICGEPGYIANDWLPPPSDIPVPYLLRPEDIIGLPPYRQIGTDMFCFFFEADQTTLQALCDRFLNIGSTYYQPIMSSIMFVASETKRTYSAPWGWMPEKDYAFWIPLAAGHHTATGFKVERIVWYQPFLFVDSSIAVKAGREVYGFNKSLAQISGSPNADAESDEQSFKGFTVRTQVSRNMNINEEVTLEKILELSGSNTVCSKKLSDQPNLSPVAEHLQQKLGQHSCAKNVKAAALMLKALSKGEVGMVFLKEMPEPDLDRLACYRAIVEAKAKVTSQVSLNFLESEFQLDIFNFASHPTTRILGLKTTTSTGDGAMAKSLAGIHIHMDFEVGQGKIIYRS